MSRIGKKFITIPSGVTVEKTKDVIVVKGPKGSSELPLHKKVEVTIADGQITCDVEKKTDKKERALWGTYRAILSHMIDGVTKGHSKELDVIGVGYKVELQGKQIVLSLGFSHPVTFPIPDGVEAKVEKMPTKGTLQHYQGTVTFSGFDKQKVGQTAANFRKLKEPENYKGKGIRYVGEQVLIKAGKVMKAGK